MEVGEKTYHSSIQIWTPQSLWLISSQIHGFRRSLSILWTRRLWKTNLWIQSEASRSDSTDLMDVPRRIAASLGSWRLGWSSKREHKRSIYDAIWIPSAWTQRWEGSSLHPLALPTSVLPSSHLHWGQLTMICHQIWSSDVPHEQSICNISIRASLMKEV